MKTARTIEVVSKQACTHIFSHSARSENGNMTAQTKRVKRTIECKVDSIAAVDGFAEAEAGRVKSARRQLAVEIEGVHSQVHTDPLPCLCVGGRPIELSRFRRAGRPHCAAQDAENE